MATLPKMGMGQKIKISPKPHTFWFLFVYFYPPSYFKRSALWTELAQGVKNLARRSIRIIKLSKSFNILQHFNQLDLAHAPNAFGPSSLGSSVLQRAPAAGPPTDTRSAGGAALVFLCCYWRFKTLKAKASEGGWRRCPKWAWVKKLRSVPNHTHFGFCLYISIHHLISNAQRCERNWPRAWKIWPAEVSGFSNFQNLSTSFNISTSWIWPMSQRHLGLDLSAVQFCRGRLPLVPQRTLGQLGVPLWAMKKWSFGHESYEGWGFGRWFSTWQLVILRLKNGAAFCNCKWMLIIILNDYTFVANIWCDCYFLSPLSGNYILGSGFAMAVARLLFVWEYSRGF